MSFTAITIIGKITTNIVDFINQPMSKVVPNKKLAVYCGRSRIFKKKKSATMLHAVTGDSVSDIRSKKTTNGTQQNNMIKNVLADFVQEKNRSAITIVTKKVTKPKKMLTALPTKSGSSGKSSAIPKITK